LRGGQRNLDRKRKIKIKIKSKKRIKSKIKSKIRICAGKWPPAAFSGPTSLAGGNLAQLVCCFAT